MDKRKEIIVRIKAFCKHVEEYKRLGIPYGLSDLRRLARLYDTPIPKINIETGELDFGKEM